jgi:hypothetical protein
VTVSPATATWSYWDYWGTQVTGFDLMDPHSDLTITASSLVETTPPGPLPKPPGWAEVTERTACSRLLEYANPTMRTTVPAELIAHAREITAGLDAHETAVAVASLVADRVSYLPGATGVNTSAAEAGSRARASARTSPTSPSPCCGALGCRPAMSPATCTRTHAVRPQAPVEEVVQFGPGDAGHHLVAGLQPPGRWPVPPGSRAARRIPVRTEQLGVQLGSARGQIEPGGARPVPIPARGGCRVLGDDVGRDDPPSLTKRSAGSAAKLARADPDT